MCLRAIGLFAALWVPLVASAMEGVEQARSLLAKMASANRQLDYEGIFTYEHAGLLKSIRITHVVVDGLEYEKLLYLNGPPREILRTGVSSNCRNFGDEFLKGVPVPSEFSTHLETHYELLLRGEDRVAGRVARILHIIPRDTMRYGYILSLDRETGLLLQSLLVGPDRRVMERFQYVDINYGIDETRALESMAVDLVPATADVDCDREIDERVTWRANWLPAGFRLVSASLEDNASASLVYSDGLSFVSVFISPDGEVAFPPIQAQRGATVAQMATLTHNGREYAVCVVGEVPPPTAERIASFIVAQ